MPGLLAFPRLSGSGRIAGPSMADPLGTPASTARDRTLCWCCTVAGSRAAVWAAGLGVLQAQLPSSDGYLEFITVPTTGPECINPHLSISCICTTELRMSMIPSTVLLLDCLLACMPPLLCLPLCPYDASYLT
jgi:hypothetical protein